ncbi:MAG: flagellar export protein FliJ [Spirochaetota bacterium]
MRRFEFQLEKVLELRRYIEREWELKLAEATSRVIEVENEIAEWSRKRRSTASVAVPTGRVDMSSVRSREQYVNLIDDRTRRLERRLVTLEAEREKVRERYLEVSRDRKALSKLKDRRNDEHRQEAKKEEIRTLDEIASAIRVGRQSEVEDHDV